jgi:hypothetical protein
MRKPGSFRQKRKAPFWSTAEHARREQASISNFNARNGVCHASALRNFAIIDRRSDSHGTEHHREIVGGTHLRTNE